MTLEYIEIVEKIGHETETMTRYTTVVVVPDFLFPYLDVLESTTRATSALFADFMGITPLFIICESSRYVEHATNI